MWRSGKGFTLIELMVVIAIILILALIAVPAYRNMQIRAKKARVQEDLRNIATALEAYYVDWNQYPPETNWDDELTGGDPAGGVNVTGATSATGEDGPITYIGSIPEDPFRPGNIYTYYVSDVHNGPWYLISAGPDGDVDSTDASNIDEDNDIVRSNQ